MAFFKVYGHIIAEVRQNVSKHAHLKFDEQALQESLQSLPPKPVAETITTSDMDGEQKYMKRMLRTLFYTYFLPIFNTDDGSRPTIGYLKGKVNW